MAENNHIDDKVSEAFGGLNQAAPNGLWNNISSDLDNDSASNLLDDKVKNAFDQGSAVAPAHIWESVNHQLNIDSVWNRIVAILDRRPWFFYWRWPAIGLLALLLTFGGYHLLNTENTEIRSSSQLGEVIYIDTTADDRITDNTSTTGSRDELTKTQQNSETGIELRRSVDLPIAANHERLLLEEHSGDSAFDVISNGPSHSNLMSSDHFAMEVGQIQNEIELPSFETEQDKDHVNDKESPEQIAPEDIAQLQLPSVTQIPQIGKSRSAVGRELDSTLFEPPTDKNYWTIGLMGGYNQTWIFNNATRNSFEPTSLISTVNTFEETFGLIVDFNFSDRSGISTQLVFSNTVSEQYRLYVEGKYTAQLLELQYSSLSGTYRRTWRLGNVFKGNKLVTQFGVYASILRKGTRTLDNLTMNATPQFNRFNYGIHTIVGYEKDKGRYTLGVGAQSMLGLANIYAGTNAIPADFNRTNTLQVGGYVALKIKL